jgi:uncharacterized membrane protein YphA (DoxX/SURF4 family)
MMRWSIRLALGALFLWAAYAKATATGGGPTLYAHWTTTSPSLRYVVPAVEGIIGIWLLCGYLPRLSALFALVMLSMFSGLLVFELTKEHPLPCGCLGTLATAYEPAAIRRELLVGIGRNVLAMIGASWIYARAAARGTRVPALTGAARATPGGSAAA